VLSRVVDVRSIDSLNEVADACFKEMGSIALVFANAGLLRDDESMRPDLDIWRLTVDVNLMGVVNCVSAFLGKMIDRKEEAQFVITGSQGSFVASPRIAAYIATKHAVWGYADCLRVEMGAGPVQVSMLAPPRVKSGITMASAERVRERQGESAVPDYLKQLWPPEELARYAFDGAIRRDGMILPKLDELSDMLKERFDPFVKVMK
jgi:NADP-dependent 3-hydroxy acid dehydrogenase YdfG